MMKSKKSQLDFQMRWPEYFFILLFILGFFIAIFAANAFYVYTFIGLAGFMTGRFLFKKKNRPPVPIYLLTYGFLFGFILALIITKRGDWRVALIIFVLSNMLSYYLHERGFISG